MRKANFIALADAAGISVDYSAGRASHPRTGEPVPYELTLDAPAGKLFNTSDCHVDCSLMGQCDPVEITPDWNPLADALRGIVAAGFSDCADPNCDTCYPEESTS